jgi:hypothetical protein
MNSWYTVIVASFALSLMTWPNPIVNVIPVDIHAHGASPFVQILVTVESYNRLIHVIPHKE